MGFINSLLGGANNFQAQGTNTALLNEAQQGVGATTAQQQAFVNQLAGQNGIQNQSNVYNQLQGVANGTGPNPAQAMLANQTGANVAQQAALMGSQRGVGSNPALLAREAAQQGGALQQNAVGQGAALQAQQSLGALGQLGNLSSQQVAQQQAGLGQLGQTQLGLSGQIANQLGQQNATNAGVAQQNAQNAQGFITGGLKGLGSAIGLADGGEVPFNDADPSTPGAAGSFLARALRDSSGGPSQSSPIAMSSGGHVPGRPVKMGDDEANDTVPAMLSPGEIVVPRTKASDPKKAAAFAAAVAARKGRK